MIFFSNILLITERQKKKKYADITKVEAFVNRKKDWHTTQEEVTKLLDGCHSKGIKFKSASTRPLT